MRGIRRQEEWAGSASIDLMSDPKEIGGSKKTQYFFKNKTRNYS